MWAERVPVQQSWLCAEDVAVRRWGWLRWQQWWTELPLVNHLTFYQCSFQNFFTFFAKLYLFSFVHVLIAVRTVVITGPKMVTSCMLSGPRGPGEICSQTEFKCESQDQCVPRGFHCDGQNDCLDGSDEIGCRKFYHNFISFFRAEIG